MQLLKQDDLIRVGRNYDGGYVISKSLMRQSSVLLSFGINDDWSFEEDFCEKSGKKCYGFDFSVSKNIFLKNGIQQIRFFFGDLLKRRQFQRKRINSAAHNFRLYGRFSRFFRKNEFVQFGIDKTTHGYFKSLDDILSEYLKGEEDIFLKIDIEGYEYKIIDDILRIAQRFHAIAMEIHGIHSDESGFGSFLEKIQSHYYIYHLHVNNYGSLHLKNGFPDVIEISCIRKDLVSSPRFYQDMSHLPLEGLDFPNNAIAPDLKW
jgi:hypothetical protein